MVTLVLSIMAANAQTSAVKGTVVSTDDGQPVIGASVFVKGTKVGAITDLDGNFSIAGVPSSATELEISYLGMKTKVVPIKAVVNVSLENDANVLQEVVVTGMQKMDKRLFTGSSAKVSADKATLDGVPEISRGL
ncbi:MAG: carboxypeptidase-like regulatory domain-containing protein, partial [Bacteroidales bacterium]|nr:carboxypeptidase-like regulatory domain-containing protein [Bacteroidales bacterium]